MWRAIRSPTSCGSIVRARSFDIATMLRRSSAVEVIRRPTSSRNRSSSPNAIVSAMTPRALVSWAGICGLGGTISPASTDQIPTNAASVRTRRIWRPSRNGSTRTAGSVAAIAIADAIDGRRTAATPLTTSVTSAIRATATDRPTVSNRPTSCISQPPYTRAIAPSVIARGSANRSPSRTWGAPTTAAAIATARMSMASCGRRASGRASAARGSLWGRSDRAGTGIPRQGVVQLDTDASPECMTVRGTFGGGRPRRPTLGLMRLAHVREVNAPAGAPWRLGAALDGDAAAGWIDLEVARRRAVASRPELAHDSVLHRQPVTTLDDHLARGLRVAALAELLERFEPRGEDGEGDPAVLDAADVVFGLPVLPAPHVRACYPVE